MYNNPLLLLYTSFHPLFRAEGILKPGNVDAHAIQESQNLSIFFATNNSITTELKKHLEEVREREREREGGREMGKGREREGDGEGGREGGRWGRGRRREIGIDLY